MLTPEVNSVFQFLLFLHALMLSPVALWEWQLTQGTFGLMEICDRLVG